MLELNKCIWFDFIDNEIDGFSFLYLTEEDIFRMFLGKVGFARKIL